MVILIKMGANIQIVKLASALVFTVRPVWLSVIVRKLYKIDKKVPADNNAIKQRWNGLGHHMAFFLHNNTDIIVTTIFLGLKFVSVYSVYYMILSGVRNIVTSIIGGGEAAFGNMIAKNEKDILNDRFKMMETLSSIIIIVFFTTAGLTLLDFVKLYINRINDMNYIMPLFGVLLAASEAIHCIKQQYHSLVLAAGHYKETQIGAFIEAGINLVLSVTLVNICGLPGIIIATIVSTVFRTFDYVHHLTTNILNRPKSVFIKRQLCNLCNVIIVIVVCRLISFPECNSYFIWTINAGITFCIALAITFFINMIFYRQCIEAVAVRVKSIFLHKR